MAHSLGLSIVQEATPVVDPLYDIIQGDVSALVALPMTSVLVQTAKAPWDKPSSGPISSCRLDHIYCNQKAGVEFLANHPKPNSMAVSSSSRSKKAHWGAEIAFFYHAPSESCLSLTG